MTSNNSALFFNRNWYELLHSKDAAIFKNEASLECCESASTNDTGYAYLFIYLLVRLSIIVLIRYFGICKEIYFFIHCSKLEKSLLHQFNLVAEVVSSSTGFYKQKTDSSLSLKRSFLCRLRICDTK